MWWKIILGLLAALIAAFAFLLSTVDITPGIILHSVLGRGADTPTDQTVQSRLQAPEGFSVGLYAHSVNNARFIEFTRQGDLIVAQPREGRVMLLDRDANGDGKADGHRLILDNLIRPHSIDFFGEYLYIGESTAVGRIRFDHVTGQVTGEYERVITGLADSGNHWTKTIRFGPDGLLYLSSGSTCNVCIEEDDQRATITRYEPDGSGEERFATGLRNAVGFDWAPFDGAMYATDNGRDLLGDDYPPCELNKVEAGNHYGWPQVNGFGDLDPDFGDEEILATATSPVHGFRAHNAPLGIRFITGSAFPGDYDNAALVALHGSWNRSSYDGYKVVSLHPDGDGGFEERDFLSGFELDGDIIGRPVDIAMGPDDCAYISDDYGMAIYRVCHGIEQTSFDVSSTSAVSDTGLSAFSEADIARLTAEGDRIYRTRGCTACHVAGGADVPFGMKPLKDLDQKYSVSSLREFYRTPTPPMPPVRLANEDEATALSVYLLTLEPQQ